jgi:molecular chaperone HtpG
MLIRLFFDAGHSWNSLYFFDVSRETVDKIKELVRLETEKADAEGMLSLEMEKVLGAMPNASGVKANVVLEINKNHAVAEKLKALYTEDKERVEKYAKLLYSQGCLIAGKSVDNPAELSELICELM